MSNKYKPCEVFNNKTLSLEKLIRFREELDQGKQLASVNYFKYQSNPSYITCFEAIQNRAADIQYVPEELQTEEMCVEVVRVAPQMFRFCHIKTPKVCCIAVKYDWTNLQYIPAEKQTSEICLEAFRQSPRATLYMRNFNDDTKRIIQNEISYKKLKAA